MSVGESALVDEVPEHARGWPEHRYEAAGGVVVRDGRVLLLRRGADEYRLPKGHVEDGESPSECAVQEVQEEAGLRRPTILALLGEVETRFALEDPNSFGLVGFQVVRRVAWYLMAVEAPAFYSPESKWSPFWCPLGDSLDLLTYYGERIPVRWAMRRLNV